MMYMHYCRNCQRIHMLNGHKHFCPKCETALAELSISYLDFIDLDMKQREELQLRCSDDEQLKHLSTTYRLFKYSKWYRKQQESILANTANE